MHLNEFWFYYLRIVFCVVSQSMARTIKSLLLAGDSEDLESALENRVSALLIEPAQSDKRLLQVNSEEMKKESVFIQGRETLKRISSVIDETEDVEDLKKELQPILQENMYLINKKEFLQFILQIPKGCARK
ncbi:hypothetical protein NEAUS04_1521 [Nematocida ausubeli]|uniref:Uncharacterized protein n=1 Tax=Nematocida ausubeli (strain ATCC PRA-371 / ERTm2) TaxID=1913371 RepID=A0A086J2P1_NEMA1|nr:uncharacterized protein NESG_01532 [Nematocida ausubeli]KAI5163386.1 hypothetical protein NEAUS04_1521 [Nematocida ausubeli]KFG26409.1 hypothetical protein NESG_01532 [Nematocida ausubeli]